MKPEKLLLELEEIVERTGYSVRRERGNFKGGYCVLEGDKILMLNKNFPDDFLAGQLARFLKSVPLEQIYIKPAVRKELERLWEMFEVNTKKKDRTLFDNAPAGR